MCVQCAITIFYITTTDDASLYSLYCTNRARTMRLIFIICIRKIYLPDRDAIYHPDSMCAILFYMYIWKYNRRNVSISIFQQINHARISFFNSARARASIHIIWWWDILAFCFKRACSHFWFRLSIRWTHAFGIYTKYLMSHIFIYLKLNILYLLI